MKQPPRRVGLVKRFEQLRYGHDLWTLWSDFLLLSATALANAVDLRPEVRAAREAEYMRVVGKYTKEEVAGLCSALGEVILQLDEDPRDVLGQAYMALELGNKWVGQFFTPDCVCQVMAGVLVDDAMRATIQEHGFVRLHEPAMGGGATVIGLHNAMREAGLNPQTQLHVTAVDVDIKAVHMAYVQLSLLGIPAAIVHGNTLSAETWSTWYTPAHILHGWSFKLRRREAAEVVELPPPAPIEQPVPVQADLFKAA